MTFIKLPFDIKFFVLSIFEWPLKTGFTVYPIMRMKCTQIIGMMMYMIQWIPMTGIEGDGDTCTLKPVISSHSKKTKKLVFKTDYCLMQVKSIAECSLGAFCNTFELH